MKSLISHAQLQAGWRFPRQISQPGSLPEYCLSFAFQNLFDFFPALVKCAAAGVVFEQVATVAKLLEQAGLHRFSE